MCARAPNAKCTFCCGNRCFRFLGVTRSYIFLAHFMLHMHWTLLRSTHTPNVPDFCLAATLCKKLQRSIEIYCFGFQWTLLFGILIAKKLVYTYRLAHFKHIRAWNRKPFCAKLKFSAVCIINFAHFVFIWILLLKSHCKCNSSSSIRFVRLNGTLYDTNELLFSRWPGLVHNIFPSFDHKLHLNRNML